MVELTRRSLVAGLAAVGAVPAMAAVDPRFAGAERRAEGLDQLHAMIVVHQGATVFARAFRGPALERAANIKSVSKSLVALLTGIAIARGEVAGTEATLGELAPALVPPDADPRVAGLTLDQLLTMRTGLQPTSGPNYGAWVSSRDWTRYALSRPFVAEPGTEFGYSTGNTHVLGAILAIRAKASLLELARERLGVPLGFEVPAWTRDPRGYFFGGNDMALTPAALAAIGEAVRADGVAGGREVLPAAWLEASLTPRVTSPFSGDGYGYGWFVRELAGVRAVYARGYGGQMLYVVPDRALTVVITSDPGRPARSEGHVGELHRLVAEDIVAGA